MDQLFAIPNRDKSNEARRVGVPEPAKAKKSTSLWSANNLTKIIVPIQIDVVASRDMTPLAGNRKRNKQARAFVHRTACLEQLKSSYSTVGLKLCCVWVGQKSETLISLCRYLREERTSD